MTGQRRPRSSDHLRYRHACITGECFDVAVERELVDFDVATTPELTLERLGFRLDRPGAITQWLAAPQPVEDDAEVPVRHRVAEKEEVASSELRRKGNGDGAGYLTSA